MPSPGIYIGDLMYKMLSGKTGEISRVQYTPQKDLCPEDTQGETHLPVSDCASQGVPASFVEEMVRALYEQPASNMHRLMIARHGHIVCDCRFAPYTSDLWHVVYSLCKSVTGMAVGFLVSEGKLSLDNCLGDFFEVPRSGLSILRGGNNKTAEITVRQLLTMTSGATFNESGAVAGNTWSAKYMSSGVHFHPGERFEYNSMNSYMLSAIVTKITGETMFEYLKPRLFTPLGITRAFWENSPEGYSKGGWGMFLRIEDMVKLGQLYLQHGMWNGRLIISRDWVEASLSAQVETGKKSAPQYGYQIWCVDTRPGAFTFNGMLGQDVFVYPDLDMIVATQAGNNDIFQENAMASTIKEMMHDADGFSDAALPDDPAGEGRLRTLLKRIREGEKAPLFIPAGGWQKKALPVSSGRAQKRYLYARSYQRSETLRAERIHQTTFDFDALCDFTYQPDNTSCGLMPLMMQIVHNNFTDGISKISFSKETRDQIVVTFTEGDVAYRIPCNRKGASETVLLDFHGEVYAVRNVARICRDEEERPVLELRICFLEEACVRIIRFLLDASQVYPYAPETVEMTLDETPGSEMMIQTLKYMTTEAPSPGRLMTTLEATGVTGALGGRVRATIRPVVTLKRM